MKSNAMYAVKAIGIYAGITLLFIVKWLAFLIEYVCRKLKEHSEKRFEQFKQLKEKLNETHEEAEGTSEERAV